MASKRDPHGLYAASSSGESCSSFPIDFQRAAESALPVASFRARAASEVRSAFIYRQAGTTFSRNHFY